MRITGKAADVRYTALAVQDDGNLVIYSSKAIWASGTDAT